MHPDFTGTRRNGKRIKTLLIILFPGNAHDHFLLPIPMLYPSHIFIFFVQSCWFSCCFFSVEAHIAHIVHKEVCIPSGSLGGILHI